MAELKRVIGARLRMIRYAALELVHGSKLRLTVVCGLVGLFWVLMFGMFLDVFLFVRTFREISGMLLDYLFAFLFLSLLVMMTISNAIIAYTSLFRSEETEFLFSLPMRAENTFAYRGSDSIVFSVWGMGTLVLPLIITYGVVFHAPLYFYPLAVAAALLFTLFVTELGALGALAVSIVLPRRRRTVLIAVAAVGVVGLAIWLVPFWWRRPEQVFSEAGIKSIMDTIAFCQHWALPSRWVAQAILLAGRAYPREAAFNLLMLLANVLFLGMVSYRLAFHAYRRTWEVVRGASTRRTYRARGLLDGLCRAGLFPLPARLRELVVKDVKSFLRDPSQWSQFLLFFGLLALYIVNLPRFGLQSLERYWHSLIATLNLGASCLTLATLTTRFVFPQLSLEGRRIWVTGLVPMRRTVILWGKFLFTAVGTFVVVAALICMSDLVIGLPGWVLGVHLVVVGCVCAGLNGLAVGLGALFPQPGTDNPSKIVASFGGTLNLICSICFIVFALAFVVVPLHLHMIGTWEGREFAIRLAGGLGLVLALSLAACVVPMLAGARAFERMEF